MKKFAAIIFASSVLAGCSSTNDSSFAKNEQQPIADQQLVSNFTRNNVKVEWGCKWFTGITEFTCVKGSIKAIEATGYATSFGNSESNRETAFEVAGDIAKSNLSRFVKDDISSSRVTNTFTKNVEKATDEYRRKGVANEITTSDKEAEQSLASNSNRTNANDVVRTVTSTISSRSSIILRGAQIIKQDIVDKQTVAVTIRWSVENSNAVNGIAKHFK